MESFFIFFPFLIWLIFIGIGALILYFVIKAAVREGINTSIIGKQMQEKESKYPKI